MIRWVLPLVTPIGFDCEDWPAGGGGPQPASPAGVRALSVMRMGGKT